MPEWLKGADCKSAGSAYVGSNPTRPNRNFNKCFTQMGCLGLEPRTYRLKAEYSTIELATLRSILTDFLHKAR